MCKHCLHNLLISPKSPKVFRFRGRIMLRLLSVKNENARDFYEKEALRGGWSVRQLNRQIDSQFYKRTATFKKQSRNAQKRRKGFDGRLHLRPTKKSKTRLFWNFSISKTNIPNSNWKKRSSNICKIFCLKWERDLRLSVGRCVCASVMNGIALIWFYLIAV